MHLWGGEREGGRERGREGMKEGEKEGEEKENERRKRGGKGERGMVNKVYYALVEVSSLYITMWMHTTPLFTPLTFLTSFPSS